MSGYGKPGADVYLNSDYAHQPTYVPLYPQSFSRALLCVSQLHSDSWFPL